MDISDEKYIYKIYEWIRIEANMFSFICRLKESTTTKKNFHFKEASCVQAFISYLAQLLRLPIACLTCGWVSLGFASDMALNWPLNG